MKVKRFPRFPILIVLILISLLAGCAELWGKDEGTIAIHILDKEPDNFINISEQQMEQFPGLKVGINSTEESQLVEISSDEWYKLRDLFFGHYGLGEYGGDIKYQDEYYAIVLYVPY